MITRPNIRMQPTAAMRLRAFTLLELILAMAVLVIMLAVSAPTLANFFHGRALDSEARQILAITHAGQSRAVAEGLPMELWVDSQQRKYGLQIESSYGSGSTNEADAKGVEFDLDKDVSIEVPNVTAAKPSLVLRTSDTPVSTASVLPINSKHASLPRIRFLPDGTCADTSPQMLRLTDREGGSLWLVLDRNRVNYAIQSTPPK